MSWSWSCHVMSCHVMSCDRVSNPVYLTPSTIYAPRLTTEVPLSKFPNWTPRNPNPNPVTYMDAQEM